MAETKYAAHELERIEAAAFGKQPKAGKCKASVFANGYHRVGRVAVASVLDGGLAGDSGVTVCLECGKTFRGFNDKFFLPRTQPNCLANARGEQTNKEH